MLLLDMVHNHDMVHYMDDHIHDVLQHNVVYIFDQLFDMDLNDRHVDMYEHHMEEVYYKVDHIKLLLYGMEPKRKNFIVFLMNIN